MGKRVQQNSKIDRATMMEALDRSGYLMEQRIFPILERAKYVVDTNPVYLDSDTGKPREYDFSAGKAYELFENAGGSLLIHIAGECKNNVQPVVFFEHDPCLKSLFTRNLKCAGIPLYIPGNRGPESDVSLQMQFNFDLFHHYGRGTQSTQYCTFTKKGNERDWMASHPDEWHSSLTSLLVATRQSVSKNLSDWRPPIGDAEAKVRIHLFYPLLILRDDIYVCSQSDSDVRLKKCDHIQYRRTVPYGGVEDVYHIDVIKESYLSGYLELLDSEHCELARRMSEHKSTVVDAARRIVRRAKEIGSTPGSGDYARILRY